LPARGHRVGPPARGPAARPRRGAARVHRRGGERRAAQRPGMDRAAAGGPAREGPARGAARAAGGLPLRTGRPRRARRRGRKPLRPPQDNGHRADLRRTRTGGARRTGCPATNVRTATGGRPTGYTGPMILRRQTVVLLATLAAVLLAAAPAGAQGPVGPINDLLALGQGFGQ